MAAFLLFLCLELGTCMVFAKPGEAMMMAEEYSENAPLSQEGEQPGGMVKLTRPDGTAIWVNAPAVAFIRGPLPGEQGHTTVVFASGAKQTVLETVEQIGEIMNAERKTDE